MHVRFYLHFRTDVYTMYRINAFNAISHPNQSECNEGNKCGSISCLILNPCIDSEHFHWNGISVHQCVCVYVRVLLSFRRVRSLSIDIPMMQTRARDPRSTLYLIKRNEVIVCSLPQNYTVRISTRKSRTAFVFLNKCFRINRVKQNIYIFFFRFSIPIYTPSQSYCVY